MNEAPGAPPLISLVVCARNAEARLPAFFAAVDAVRAAVPWEIVLVDNASTDGTRAAMEAYSGRAAVPVRVTAEQAPGNGAGRNAGAAVAAGEVLCFTDDDCYVAPDLIEVVARVFADARVGLMSGRILLHDPDDYPLTINLTTERLRWPAGSFLRPGLVQGANMAIRARALADAGGFDPAFGAGAAFAGEDMEIANRVLSAGWDGVFEPDAVVRHHHRRKAAQAQALMRVYEVGVGATYAKLALALRPRRRVVRDWLGYQKYFLQVGRRREVGRQWRGFAGYLLHAIRRRARA